MALRDKDRLHAVFRSHDGPDELTILYKRRALPPPAARLCKGSDEAGLGTADGWHIEKKPHVGRETEAPRVGHPLSVEEGHIGPFPQLSEGLQ